MLNELRNIRKYLHINENCRTFAVENKIRNNKTDNRIMEKEVKQLPKTAKCIRRDWDKSVYESKKGVYYVYNDCIKRIY